MAATSAAVESAAARIEVINSASSATSKITSA